MPWIETVPWDEASGELKEAYDWQAQKLGAPAEFTQLGSLYPELVAERLRLYRVVEGCPSALSPIERQAAALVASVLNSTEHCASGLRLKLGDLGAPPDVVAAVERDPADVETGDARFDAICAYAATLTRDPGATTAAHLDDLRRLGLSDLDLLDLNNIVAYYCYINRVATGLGLRTPIATVHDATNALPS
jgi:uncharacterized peroxidase-related enzyme